MPDGRVMRIDNEQQLVYIVRRGRGYEAALSDVESPARVPSARVQFSLRRDDGVDYATDVTLRSGTRTSKRQRRFGDLTGARQPGAKVSTTAQTSLGITVTTQPFRVVRAWIEAIDDLDFDGALSLYQPSAGVHTTDGTVSGRGHIQALLETCRWTGDDPASAELHGVDRYVRATCESEGMPMTTYFEIDSGQINQQWLGTEPDLEDEPEGMEVQVVRKGLVAESDAAYAREKLDHVGRLIDAPVIAARVKLARRSSPEVPGSATAQATLDIDGSLVRAHAAGSTVLEAIDLVIRRLESRLEHLSDRERHKASGVVPSPGEWHHGNLPSPQRPYFDRPEEERELVRHKSFAPGEMTLEEAAWDMGLLDYDFFLFVDLSTGSDVLLEQTVDGDLLVHELIDLSDGDRQPPDLPPAPQRWQLAEPTSTSLYVDEAIDFLNQSDERFVFFGNRATGRGNVVYRRYDGHYGLITPPSEATLDTSQQR